MDQQVDTEGLLHTQINKLECRVTYLENLVNNVDKSKMTNHE